MSKAAYSDIDPDEMCPDCLEFNWTGIECSACGFTSDANEQNSDKLGPGTILDGRYCLGLVLGHEGGFGVTYKGRNLATPDKDKVAIKEYMPSQLAGRSQRSQDVRPNGEKAAEYFAHGLMRFRQEAELLGSFNHPHIVRVCDYFEGNRTGYLVMPFIEGKTLAQFVKRKGNRIDFSLALNILTPIMDALRYSHERGLIHRDISPENIYITATGQGILLDFGAARSPIPGLALTRLMKVGFSPPEVILGRDQGPFTDVYGLAATLYSVCTGQEPPLSTERKSDEAVSPPSCFGVEISKFSEDALIRALSVRPEDRFQSIAELRKHLVGDGDSTPEPPKVTKPDVIRPDPPPQKEGWGWAPKLLLVLIIVLLLLLVLAAN